MFCNGIAHIVMNACTIHRNRDELTCTAMGSILRSIEDFSALQARPLVLVESIRVNRIHLPVADFPVHLLHLSDNYSMKIENIWFNLLNFNLFL